MKDNERGLYSKYTVIKNATGEPIDGDSFILRPDIDLAAREALRAYMMNTINPELRKDLQTWLSRLAESKPLCDYCWKDIDVEMPFQIGERILCDECQEELY